MTACTVYYRLTDLAMQRMISNAISATCKYTDDSIQMAIPLGKPLDTGKPLAANPPMLQWGQLQLTHSNVRNYDHGCHHAIDDNVNAHSIKSLRTNHHQLPLTGRSAVYPC